MDGVQDLVCAYNNNYRSTIKIKPVNQVNVQNAFNVFNIYGNFGDVVRVSKACKKFTKGYEQTFSDEYFIVAECLPRAPLV